MGLSAAPAFALGAPGSPTITSVTRGNASIVVAFSPPASDGGFPILSYAASCTSSNGGVSGSNTGAGSPITVSGLTNGASKTVSTTLGAIVNLPDADSLFAGLQSRRPAPVGPSRFSGVWCKNEVKVHQPMDLRRFRH